MNILLSLCVYKVTQWMTPRVGSRTLLTLTSDKLHRFSLTFVYLTALYFSGPHPLPILINLLMQNLIGMIHVPS